MNCIYRSCIDAIHDIDAVAYELPPALLRRSHLGPYRVRAASNIDAYETPQTMSFTSHLRYRSVHTATSFFRIRHQDGHIKVRVSPNPRSPGVVSIP